MHDAVMRALTAVMASVFWRCASCAVRARLSAAIVTHARSGACFTTPSPMVTMTGGPEGVCGCAYAGAAEARAARMTGTRCLSMLSPGSGLKTRQSPAEAGHYSEHATRKPIAYEY